MTPQANPTAFTISNGGSPAASVVVKVTLPNGTGTFVVASGSID